MNNQSDKKFFWLHIKKCGGTSVKHFLGDLYNDIPNQSNIPSFIQVEKKYWNSILNNSRCNLGDYITKRVFFAKEFLFKDEWPDIFSFVFLRDPYDRCLSMFYYLMINNEMDYLKLIIKLFIKRKKIIITKSNLFDWFLEILDIIHRKNQKEKLEFRYKTNHFIIHTNPYSNDLTDLKGNILIKNLFKIENFKEEIKKVFIKLKIDPNYNNLIKKINLKISQEKETNNLNKMNTLIERKNYLEKHVSGEINNFKLNSNNNKKLLLNSKQIKKIENIYFNDFEIYRSL